MSTSYGIRILTALTTLTLLAISLDSQAGWKTGSILPDLAKFKLEGPLPNLKGKVIMIDFWASWCGPCKASFPILNSLQQEYGPKGFVIVAVNQDETSTLMKAFLAENPASFVTLRDGGNKLVESADVQSMPSSFLIDRSGKIRFIHTGFHGEKTAAKYKEEIEQLLKEQNEVKP